MVVRMSAFTFTPDGPLLPVRRMPTDCRIRPPIGVPLPSSRVKVT